MQKRKRRWKRALGLLLFLAAAVGMGKVYPAEAGKETIEFPEVHQEEQIAQGLFVNYISLPDGWGCGHFLGPLIFRCHPVYHAAISPRLCRY